MGVQSSSSPLSHGTVWRWKRLEDGGVRSRKTLTAAEAAEDAWLATLDAEAAAPVLAAEATLLSD